MGGGLVLFLLAACSTERAGERPSGGIDQPYKVNGVWYRPRHQPDYDEVGLASWYGPGFQGRRTASGRTYDPYGMTAAHATLPLGTRVVVTNLENGRSVALTVNDRGPFVRGRIIDVSRRAAQRLGMSGTGTARVRVRIAEPGVRVASLGAPDTRGARDTPHAQAALDAAFGPAAPGTLIPWRDPVSGRHGVIVPLTASAGESGPACRNYRRTAIGGGMTALYVGRACRQPDDRWRIVREDPAPVPSVAGPRG